ncbi:MFS transporter [Streptomyces cocklensis]|uniref:MFS transporter n=1 Tax=Actinacidiphila cocklensis TaxID=887465 RepID=A0A9W4GT03_9ACTN|nr:MFS transporter [Actinacidiphila cocklensis]MDD1063395.1 MFS transporter [Actinacidiphila cocklensis]WSX74849.1 MFS transporter [Streptomyces sp. NBC_00899]CAG6395992.1 MFS transporter [Actinacidiphila cocklensis]
MSTEHGQVHRGGTAARGAGSSEVHRWWTLTAVCVGTFMLLLDITIVNVALPDVQKELHSSFSGLQWVVDAYALTLASTLLTCGSLADLFGRRRAYLTGLTLFTAASLLCGLANGTLFLELARGAQGIGGAAMFAVSLALLAETFRGKDRGIAFGIWGAVTGLAVAVGPVVGGALTSGLSWRWIFFVNVPVGLVAVAITWTRVRESRDPRPRRPDWWGFLSFTASLAFLVLALIKSGELGFSDSLVLECFAAAAVLFAAFLAVQVAGREPMFDLSLLSKPTFSGGLIAAFGMSASMFAMLLYLTLYLQDVLGYSAFGTGLRLLTASATIFVVSAVSGRLSSHVPVRLLIGPGGIVIGLSLLWMRGLDAGSQWTHLVPGLLLGGVGIGLINPPLASTAVGVVPPRQAGMASGVNSTSRQVGIATGIALLGSLFAARVQSVVTEQLGRVPGLGPRAPQIASSLTDGRFSSALRGVPARQRPAAALAARTAFTAGLNHILLVAAVIALVSGVLSLLLIRGQDFVPSATDE